MNGFRVGTSEWPDGGFAGIRVNPVSLMPEIVNEEACAAELRPPARCLSSRSR